MGLTVKDTNGNLKLSKMKLGTGLSLGNPVLIPNGGIGLTTVSQGDMIYGGNSVTKTYPTPSVVAPGGYTLLSNQAANLNLTGQYSNGTYGPSSTRGWVGYNGVTQLTEAEVTYTPGSFPSGTPIAYFATTALAASLELLVSGVPIVARLAKSSSGIKMLMNTGTGYEPAWADPATQGALFPQYGTRKTAIGQFGSPATTIFLNTWTVLQDGTTTALNEILGTWLRNTTAGSGTNAGNRLNQNWCWLDHNPTLRGYLRTGASLTGVRIWFILANTSAAVSNSDDQHALKGVGLRYSSGAPDPGWVTWKADGTTQTVSGGAVVAIAANTIYPISISVTGGGANFTVSIGDSTSTVSVPSGALGTMMRFNIQITTTDANSKFIDLMNAISGDWD